MFIRKTYFIREHVGFMKLADTYDILDPDSQLQIGIAKEKPGSFVKMMRVLISKQLMPTRIFVYEGDNPDDEARLMFSIHRGVALFKSRVTVQDATGRMIGILRSKFFSLGGAFRVYDALGTEVALVKGDWKGWNFRFLNNAGIEIGKITKKWSGIGKEMFTSADNYIISLNEEPERTTAILLLAAGLAVDTVYKEK